MLQIKCKIALGARIPLKAHPTDAGFDLFPSEDFTLQPGEFKAIATGVNIALPEGCEAQVRPRSGLAIKHGVTVLNSPGTIDANYRGEIKVILINHGKEAFALRSGEKAIAQLVIATVIPASFEQVEVLDTTDRGESGFGSTDKGAA